MSISERLRRTTLAEVLALIEKINNKPVRRDGSPAKHLQIRTEVRKMYLNAGGTIEDFMKKEDT